MATQTTAVLSVRVRVPIALNGVGLTLEPALSQFVSTATPLTVDGHIYQQEVHDNAWTSSWEQLEFITTTGNAVSLENAASTLQTSINTLNGNPTPAIVVDAQAEQSTRVTFS